MQACLNQVSRLFFIKTAIDQAATHTAFYMGKEAKPIEAKKLLDLAKVDISTAIDRYEEMGGITIESRVTQLLCAKTDKRKDRIRNEICHTSSKFKNGALSE